jgi:hypothetical protein
MARIESNTQAKRDPQRQLAEIEWLPDLLQNVSCQRFRVNGGLNFGSQ